MRTSNKNNGMQVWEHITSNLKPKKKKTSKRLLPDTARKCLKIDEAKKKLNDEICPNRQWDERAS